MADDGVSDALDGRVVGLVADDGISDAVDGRVVGVVADDGARVAAGGVVVPAVPPHAATANKMAEESPTRSRWDRAGMG